MERTVIDNHYSDDEFQAEILRLTGTKCLVSLQDWCELNHISRMYWAELYQDVFSIVSGSDRKIKKEVFSCVSEKMDELKKYSEKICELLGWVIIPSTSGFGSQEIFDGNILVEIIFQYGGGYSVHNSKNRGLHGDMYSAALDLVSREVIENILNVESLKRSFAI